MHASICPACVIQPPIVHKQNSLGQSAHTPCCRLLSARTRRQLAQAARQVLGMRLAVQHQTRILRVKPCNSERVP